MTTRREFLSDLSHRIRFVYLPKHSSWLNRIEIFFGILHRKCLRGGTFTSVLELESQIREFITYYNTTIEDWRTWNGTYWEGQTNYAPPITANVTYYDHCSRRWPEWRRV